MFAPRPGFEELPIRADVKWRRCRRPVVARLEQWPESDKAVLVCRFEDDENAGEWLVLEPQGDVPYFVGKAALARLKVREHTREKRLIAKALERRSLSAGRLFFWPDLPAPNIVIATLSRRGIWLNSWQNIAREGAERPRFDLRFEIGEMNAEAAEKLILQASGERESDAQFSRGWAQLSADEKRRIVTGYGGDFAELSQLMSWVLMICADWRADKAVNWEWNLALNAALRWHVRNTSTGRYGHDISQLQAWETLLKAHFVPHLNTEYLDKYPCVRDFARRQWRVIGRAEVRGEASAHQQLEAKLALRDWLRTIAPLDVAGVALASLEN